MANEEEEKSARQFESDFNHFLLASYHYYSNHHFELYPSEMPELDLSHIILLLFHL